MQTEGVLNLMLLDASLLPNLVVSHPLTPVITKISVNRLAAEKCKKFEKFLFVKIKNNKIKNKKFCD